MLNKLINHNDQIPFNSTSLTRFHSRSPPTISVKDYLKRIDKYTIPDRICFILILNYIDRICQNLLNFTICSLTVHRFCITSVMIGAKFMSDSFYSNSRYAKVGGISLTEINLLEREFLLAIDYRLLTNNAELDKYYISLVESHPFYKIDSSLKRATAQSICESEAEDNQHRNLRDNKISNQVEQCDKINVDSSVIVHSANHLEQSVEQPILSSSPCHHSYENSKSHSPDQLDSTEKSTEFEAHYEAPTVLED